MYIHFITKFATHLGYDNKVYTYISSQDQQKSATKTGRSDLNEMLLFNILKPDLHAGIIFASLSKWDYYIICTYTYVFVIEIICRKKGYLYEAQYFFLKNVDLLPSHQNIVGKL